MAGRLKIRLGFRQKLLLVCALVCVLTLSMVFVYLDRRQEAFYLQSMKIQARALFNQIVLTRKWIADHGGIFVEQLPWVSPNPYLEKDPVVDAGSRKFVRENPAMVTRELSEYAKKQGSYWFHITSLKPVNPANAPDEFERRAMGSFETEGTKEAWGVSPIDGAKYFRYTAPLYVEAACLECHSRHGYRLGDVRGAISVAIPVEAFYTSLNRERTIAAAFTVAVALILMLGLYLALNRVLVKPISRLRDFAMAWRKGTSPSTRNSQVTGNAAGAPKDCPEGFDVAPGDVLHDLYMELCNLHSAVTSQQIDLERKIMEATEELSIMNEQLAYARDRYRESSQIKSDFIAGLSHELRTPLTSVKGALGYITEKIEGGDLCGDHIQKELAPFLDIINRNINRFVKLVEETLDLEKIESDQLQLHFAKVDFSNLLKEAQEEFMPLAEQRAIEIKVSTEGTLMIRADRDRIRQVLDNLIVNALRHSPDGSELLLDGYQSGNWLIVRVVDQGPGIPPDNQKKVFERYYKGSKEGTGLGLTISKGIINSHGGEIGVDSDGRHGSAFYFKLPAGDTELMGNGL